DEKMKSITIAPKAKWAVGTDNKDYELAGSLDGRRFQDVYVINMQTGERKLMLKKSRWTFGTSPDGTQFLYYDDGHFYTCEMATGNTLNITSGAPVSFVNTEDDHNVLKQPQFPVGWTSDSASVILTDGWDWWKLPAHGGSAVNLTVDGKKDSVRYQRDYTLER